MKYETDSNLKFDYICILKGLICIEDGLDLVDEIIMNRNIVPKQQYY